MKITEKQIKKQVLCITVFTLLFVIVFSFCGCKKSEVLFHTTYNQKAEQKSNDDQMIDNEDYHDDVNEDLSSKEERDEAEKKREFENTEAVENNNNNNIEAAKSVESPRTNDRENGYGRSGSSQVSAVNQSTVNGNENGAGFGGAQLGGGSGGIEGSVLENEL